MSWLLPVHDRAHGKFRLQGRADLAHQDQIERRLQPIGDLGRDRNATARQRQDHGMTVLVFRQSCGQLMAGIISVLKQHIGRSG